MTVATKECPNRSLAKGQLSRKAPPNRETNAGLYVTFTIYGWSLVYTFEMLLEQITVNCTKNFNL